MRRVAKLLSMEWPPSTPIRLATFFELKASLISVQEQKVIQGDAVVCWLDESDIDECLTFTGGGKLEGVWIFWTNPVDHVYLLQSLSDSIFVLRVTGYIGRPELKERIGQFVKKNLEQIDILSTYLMVYEFKGKRIKLPYTVCLRTTNLNT